MPSSCRFERPLHTARRRTDSPPLRKAVEAGKILMFENNGEAILACRQRRPGLPWWRRCAISRHIRMIMK